MTAANLAAFGVAISLLATALGSAAHLERDVWRALHWRAALLGDPVAARAAACGQQEAKACELTLLLRQGQAWVTACGVPARQPEPARYYRVRVECRFWPGFPRRRLLDLVIFR